MNRTRFVVAATRLTGVAGVVLMAAGCDVGIMMGGVPAGPPVYATAAPLMLQPVSWNVNKTPVGKIAAVTELEDSVVVFSDAGTGVFAGGALTAADASVTAWQSAATIPAADKTGSWAVGVDAKGHLQRLKAVMSIEDVTDRYGLLDTQISAVAPMGGNTVAFAISTGLAVADGAKVVRYDTGPLTSLAAGLGRAAGIAADGSVHVFNNTGAMITVFSLTDAVGLAFGLDGKLVVATKHALYVEKAPIDGTSLVLLYKDDAGTFHGLTASAGWVWAAIDGELMGLRGGAGGMLLRTSGLSALPSGQLAGSTSGDAWVLGSGMLFRYTLPVTGDEATWRTSVLPVYARVCSACHAPGGTSGFPLVTYAQWVSLKSMIYQRVIVKGDMPQGRTIADADKAAIAGWSKP